MGVQIAALLAATGRRVLLLDVTEVDDPTARTRRALERARTTRPPVFYAPEMVERIEIGHLDDLSPLTEVDWIIEAVVEDLEAKRQLLARLDSDCFVHALVSSNTSGLSIADLSKGRSRAFHKRFIGVHFFNPPRHMKLVEIIADAGADAGLVDDLIAFLQDELGKGVVRARDTPNFIGNRLGVFAIFSMLHLMQEEHLSVAEVDALSGPLMGRPSSATLRLCDLIGLDTLARVAETAHCALVSDPWRARFSLPPLVVSMLDAGLLGAKVGAGFYRKTDRGIHVLNPRTLDYEEAVTAELGDLNDLGGGVDSRVAALWNNEGRWGRIGRKHLREVLLYAAWHIDEIAERIEEVDNAMRWGFNWEMGPFALWDLLGAERILEDGAPVPPRVRTMRAAGCASFFTQEDASDGDPLGTLFGREGALFANDEAYISQLDDGLAALVFCGKMNALGPGVVEAIRWIESEVDLRGLLLCGVPPHFSVGANLRYISSLKGDALNAFLCDFQAATEYIRRAPFPVVAAVEGLCLGGGCEFSLAADRRIIAAEARIGLVEAGVGLVPSGGGIVHMARTQRGDRLQAAFAALCTGAMSENAYAARAVGYALEEDEILLNPDRLHMRGVEALQELSATWVGRGEDKPVPVAGAIGLERLVSWIDERFQGGDISAHDAAVGHAIANVLCGAGGLERACSADALLALEREAFMTLSACKETQQRIEHMLSTGKRLNN